MHRLVMIRHGESQWNLENRFTGWVDVDISNNGIKEAEDAARLLNEAGFSFNRAHTSLLKRAIRTLWIILDKMDLMWIPVEKSWRLNERHYGALQGLNKTDTAEKYGKKQVHIWRRSYNVKPPLLTPDDPVNPAHERRYANLLQEEITLGESLEDTLKRVLPYWDEVIVPQIKNGDDIFISAHGNSIRALVKHLDAIPDEDIPQLNIPTGKPLIYELDETLMPLRHYYLGEL